MKERTLFILTAFLIALIFYPVLTAFFFMDDFYFLLISRATNVNEFFRFFSPIKFIPYRPISQQLFFFSMQKIFGLNPLPYHLLILFIHLLNSWFIYKTSFFLIRSKNRSYLLSLIYAISAIHFVGLFSVTGSYFIFGTFYFLISLYFWLCFINKHNSKYYFLSFLFFIFAVFSSEITMVLPIIFLLISRRVKIINNTLRSIPFFLVNIINLFINYQYAGPPKTNAFMMDFKAFPYTLRWYLLRAFGLPEGIKNGLDLEKKLIYLLFFLLLLIILYGFRKNFKQFKSNLSKIISYTLWIILGSAPFLFLPDHLNPIYFSISFFGFILIIDIILGKKLLLFTCIYIFISLIGVRLLMNTHWTVRRSKLAKFWITKTINSISKPQNSMIELILPDKNTKEELQITLQGSKALKLYYDDPGLNTVYKVY